MTTLWVNESQLEEWVDGHARDAEGLIPELIARLVAASCPNARERRFQRRDSVGQQGPDGWLVTDVGHPPFVPEGQSLWEIGTGRDAGDKATRDYADQTLDVPEDVRKETTFVFVTPRSSNRTWPFTWKKGGQAKWIDKRRKEGKWKDVRVIDGTRLVEWVASFQAVAIWLTKIVRDLGRDDVELPEDYWKELRSYGSPPPLTPDLFLGNRDGVGSKLTELLEDKVVQVRLTTNFPRDVVDYVCAYLASLDEPARSLAQSRCIIVRQLSAWEPLCASKGREILIADPSLDLAGERGTRLIQKARNAGHGLVFAAPVGGNPDPTNVPLHSPRPHEVQAALVKAGYKEERARVLALQTARSLQALLRCMQGVSTQPGWAENDDASDLRIANLIGAWRDDTPADREEIEKLAGKAYGEWIATTRRIAARPGTPLIHHENAWKFIARYEGWYALGQHLFSDDLNRFRSSLLAVLGTNDPQFELPKERRFAAAIHGKILPHSQLFREGLANGLALLGSLPDALTRCPPGLAIGVARATVGELLKGADWTRWASLNDVLPLLAEAAPGEFLTAVDQALQQVPTPFLEVFRQEGSGGIGRNYMTGLLWALETLAWDPQHLNAAVLALAGLATHDPGGQWGNRPANSLREIFLPWLPQTCASIEKRVAAVSSIISMFPDVGWRLLLTLMPTQHSVSQGTRRPAWRPTIADTWTGNVTVEEYANQVNAYSELAINGARARPALLADLVGRLDDLPLEAVERLLAHLNSDAVLSLGEAERQATWNALQDLVTRHRKFADADWAMNPELVNRVAEIAAKLTPPTASYRYERLFAQRSFDLFEEPGDFEEQERRLQARRTDAIKEIAAQQGLRGVIAFGSTVEYPGVVGITLGLMQEVHADSVVLPDMLLVDDKAPKQFVGGYVRARLQRDGWHWVDELPLAEWTEEQRTRFLCLLPFKTATWERASNILGDQERLYWQRAFVNPYEADPDLGAAIDKLLKFDRPRSAISCVYLMAHHKSMDVERASRTLLAASTSEEAPNSIGGNDAYQIAEVIKTLQQDKQTREEDLFKIEWAFLGLLDEHLGVKPRTLTRRLASDPAFYCHVIGLVFRPRGADKTEIVSERKKEIAGNAYDLLRKWDIPPGTRPDGTFDPDALGNWLSAVKEECSRTGHLEVAMIHVGQPLIHAPADPGGLWIHRGAAAVLNAPDADAIRRGFSTALYNSRGVHWVDPTGGEERAIAERYRRKADATDAAGFTRLATLLREIAASYEQDAERIVARKEFEE